MRGWMDVCEVFFTDARWAALVSVGVEDARVGGGGGQARQGFRSESSHKRGGGDAAAKLSAFKRREVSTLRVLCSDFCCSFPLDHKRRQ